jgi:hypothetical protein
MGTIPAEALKQAQGMVMENLRLIGILISAWD